MSIPAGVNVRRLVSPISFKRSTPTTNPAQCVRRSSTVFDRRHVADRREGRALNPVWSSGSLGSRILEVTAACPVPRDAADCLPAGRNHGQVVSEGDDVAVARLNPQDRKGLRALRFAHARHPLHAPDAGTSLHQRADEHIELATIDILVGSEKGPGPTSCAKRSNSSDFHKVAMRSSLARSNSRRARSRWLARIARNSPADSTSPGQQHPGGNGVLPDAAGQPRSLRNHRFRIVAHRRNSTECRAPPPPGRPCETRREAVCGNIGPGVPLRHRALADAGRGGATFPQPERRHNRDKVRERPPGGGMTYAVASAIIHTIPCGSKGSRSGRGGRRGPGTVAARRP